MAKFIKKISKSRGLAPGTLVHIGEGKTEQVKIKIIDYIHPYRAIITFRT